MAFPKAANYGNLPNGAFSPTIYSRRVQKAFRKSSVVDGCTNTDYFGEISNMGDSVRIIKEPDITVSDYARGTQLATQTITDKDFSLVVDQASYFQFAVDDIEANHSHVNFQELATDRAAYKLKDEYDANVLGYMSGWVNNSGTWTPNTTVHGTKANESAGADELLDANKLRITNFGGSELGGSADGSSLSGTNSGNDDLTSIPIKAGGGAGPITSPLALLNRIARLMDQANVDQEGRWFIADPVFYEILMDEDSKFINSDFMSGNGVDTLRNGKLSSAKVRGFRIHKSNNLPYKNNGPANISDTGSEHSYGIVVAGHDSAVATATQINKTESFRSPDTFADVVRGMLMYGRKILRPETIFTANYNSAA